MAQSVEWTPPPELTKEDNFIISWSKELEKLKQAELAYAHSGLSPTSVRKRISQEWICFVCWSTGHFPGKDCPRVRELHTRGLINQDTPLDNLFAGNVIFHPQYSNSEDGKRKTEDSDHQPNKIICAEQEQPEIQEIGATQDISSSQM